MVQPHYELNRFVDAILKYEEGFDTTCLGGGVGCDER